MKHHNNCYPHSILHAQPQYGTAIVENRDKRNQQIPSERVANVLQAQKDWFISLVPRCPRKKLRVSRGRLGTRLVCCTPQTELPRNQPHNNPSIFSQVDSHSSLHPRLIGVHQEGSASGLCRPWYWSAGLLVVLLAMETTEKER